MVGLQGRRLDCLLPTADCLLLLLRCQRFSFGTGRAVSEQMGTNPDSYRDLTRSSLTSWRKSRRRVKRSEHIGVHRKRRAESGK